MRIGFDLDGCLFDFKQSVEEYMDSIGLEYAKEIPDEWDFFTYWGMDTKQFVQLCHDGVDAGYIFRNNVRPNAVDAVKIVKNLGHEIIVITDRSFGATPSVSEQATYDWWNWAGFPEFDEMHFSADKTIAPTDMFVEDKLSNYDALVAAGVDTFLIDRPWNQVEGGDDRVRIPDIIDYAVEVAWLSTAGIFRDTLFANA